MKKIYSISVSLLFLASGLFSQGAAGFFQITVTDLPGAATNRVVVKMRATNNLLVPSISTCDGDDIPITDLITGLNWYLKWPTSTLITSVAVTSGSPNAQGACPDPAGGTGYGITFTAGVTTSNDGLTKGRGFYVNPQPCVVPIDWILNEWTTICTLTLTGGNCTVCEDLDIYNLGDVPEWEAAGTDCTHSMSYSLLGGAGIIYDATPFNGLLPLNLISFTADKSGTQDALVSWTTSNEENTSHFKIQRSFDKKNWYDAGSIAAAGYSIDVRNYSFMDYKVYNGLDARLNVYYRLSMVDLDGRTKLSPMQTVVFGTNISKGREFVVYPNPASDGIQVEWDANRDDQPTTLEFFDISGKLVYSQDVGKNTNQEYIDFGHTTIQPGLYLLRIIKGDEPLDHKQIVVGRD